MVEIEAAAAAEAKAAGPSVLGDLSALNEQLRAAVLLEEIKALKQGGNNGKDVPMWTRFLKAVGATDTDGWNFKCDYTAFMAEPDLPQRFKDDCPRQIFRGVFVEVTKGFESFCKDDMNKTEVLALCTAKTIGFRFVKAARVSQRFKYVRKKGISSSRLLFVCCPDSDPFFCVLM